MRNLDLEMLDSFFKVIYLGVMVLELGYDSVVRAFIFCFEFFLMVYGCIGR